MASTQTPFDLLLKTARDLDITIVTGRLWTPRAGHFWIGDQSLAEVLLPHVDSDTVALAVVPGGPGWEHIHPGKGRLDAHQLARLTQVVTEAGGHVYQGKLEELTPKGWIERHGGGQQAVEAESVLDAARAVGWPANLDDYSVLFLDDKPIFHLLARENAGRNVTLLAGMIASDAGDSRR